MKLTLVFLIVVATFAVVADAAGRCGWCENGYLYPGRCDCNGSNEKKFKLRETEDGTIYCCRKNSKG